jgi:hypothetical protein
MFSRHLETLLAAKSTPFEPTADLGNAQNAQTPPRLSPPPDGVAPARVAALPRLEDIAAQMDGLALCWRCLVTRLRVAPAELDDALSQAARGPRARLRLAPCEECRRDTLLYALT